MAIWEAIDTMSTKKNDGYLGSYRYYVDEEERNREEEERLRELGIDPYDD